MEFQIHPLQVMQQAFAKLSLLNVYHTLAESTFPFHLCPDNDLMANYKRIRTRAITWLATNINISHICKRT